MIKYGIVNFILSKILAFKRRIFIFFLGDFDPYPKHKYITYSPSDYYLKKVFSSPLKLDLRAKNIGNGLNWQNIARKKQIIAVAEFKVQKGLKYLIEAFSNLKKNDIFKEYVLLIIGDGRLRDELENQIQSLDMVNHIYLPGKKNPITGVGCRATFTTLDDMEKRGINTSFRKKRQHSGRENYNNIYIFLCGLLLIYLVQKLMKKK